MLFCLGFFFFVSMPAATAVSPPGLTLAVLSLCEVYKELKKKKNLANSIFLFFAVM